MWLGVVLEAHRQSRLSQYTKDPLTVQQEGLSLLLAGTNEGHLALVDHTTGDVQLSLKVVCRLYPRVSVPSAVQWFKEVQ